jgi:hypothetical protein
VSEIRSIEECQKIHERLSDDYERIIDSNTAAMHDLAAAIRDQQKSLPVKEVMKLFSFFAVLVLGLIAGVFGIKEVFNVSGVVSSMATSQVQQVDKGIT